MKEYKLAILKNESKDDHIGWINACEKVSSKVNYDVIDFVSNDWLERITLGSYNFLLTRPPGRIAYYKQLYDERIYILNCVLNIPIYPTLNELMVYENKRFLSYFLKARNIPHPETWVLYNRDEATQFVKNCNFPIVAKTNIGAGGSGVKILKNRNDAMEYILASFSEKGISRSFLPNIRKRNYLNRLKRRLSNVHESLEYFREKKKAATIEPQKWFVIFQEYIKSDYEWRCVAVEDSYFGHKKLRTFGEMMSGTSSVSWDIPDESLLNFLKKIIDDNNFLSQAIDIFYDENKGYLVNELQCFWGSKNPHQMMKDGNPGRFVFRQDKWIFEEGVFNQNNSYDLRLKHVLNILENK